MAVARPNRIGNVATIDRLDSLVAQFREVEAKLLRELQRKRQECYCEVRKGKIHFTEEARAGQKKLLTRAAAETYRRRIEEVRATSLISRIVECPIASPWARSSRRRLTESSSGCRDGILFA